MNNPTQKQPSPPRKEGTRNIVIGQNITSAKLQRAKELRHQMTPEEKILWQHLRANPLNGFHFRRQQIIDGFIADFYCHAAALVIELVPQGGSQKSKVKSQKYYGMRFLGILNGCPIYAALY